MAQIEDLKQEEIKPEEKESEPEEKESEPEEKESEPEEKESEPEEKDEEELKDKEKKKDLDDRDLKLLQRAMRGDFGSGNNMKLCLGKKYDFIIKQIELNNKAKIKNWKKVKIIK